MKPYVFPVLNQPPDPSVDFVSLGNLFYNAHVVRAFDPAARAGTLLWTRHTLEARVSFNTSAAKYYPAPCRDYPPDPSEGAVLPFDVSFVSPRTVRLRFSACAPSLSDGPSPMLTGPVPSDASWTRTNSRDKGAFTWTGPFGSLTITMDPFHVILRDADGKLLTQTNHMADAMGFLNAEPTPFSFVQRPDQRCHLAASFALAPDEKIFGCGESFTRLNKRSQKLLLSTVDANGVLSAQMYKPIPFFLSSRGYAMFVHSSVPMTFDFGHTHDAATVLTLADDTLDLFIFLGSPQDCLSEYTTLTGRSPVPPLWSFGLWMSRITYFSETEVRDVAARLRSHRIPADVIHVDTGWFEHDWRCDYRFSPSRFPNPEKMLADLREQHIRLCLWQLPYFSPANDLFPHILDRGYAVLDADGKLPTPHAVLDFSNPVTVAWYQSLLKGLLDLGVSTIKVDFGEAAPYNGCYASGRSGTHEHNLYPLRYNAAAAQAVHDVTGEHIIWARAAWAGSQRYPVHWGGDAENTDAGLAATLRAGLSLGLSGFSFWSHDIGGFCKETPENLYRRWLPFGMLSSHSRAHGKPPKEPWLYNESFTDAFRQAVELKYRLMPYVYAQAVDSATRGLPMLRALFLEYPDDPASWLVEDEYLFGRDLLVAPLLEDGDVRDVYLPPGVWVDYQTGRSYEGARYHRISASPVPCVILVRAGAAIPHAQPAQSTDEIDWSRIELRTFAPDSDSAEALVALPDDNVLHVLSLSRRGGGFVLDADPLKNRVTWDIRTS